MKTIARTTAMLAAAAGGLGLVALIGGPASAGALVLNRRK